MRYLLLIADEETAHPSPAPPDPAVMGQVIEAYNAYTQMLRQRGAYLGGEALQPVTTASTVRVRDGQTLTTDGPFIEAKEAFGGYYLVEARDLDEALEFAAACPGAQTGSIEVRPVWEIPDGASMEVAASAH
ncbi:MAG: YciI family protein [Candidatus Limnocylindria bacterium]